MNLINSRGYGYINMERREFNAFIKAYRNNSCGLIWHNNNIVCIISTNNSRLKPVKSKLLNSIPHRYNRRKCHCRCCFAVICKRDSFHHIVNISNDHRFTLLSNNLLPVVILWSLAVRMSAWIFRIIDICSHISISLSLRLLCREVFIIRSQCVCPCYM